MLTRTIPTVHRVGALLSLAALALAVGCAPTEESTIGSALLMAAHEDPPYVLVGFSFGGLVTQLYASSHSAEIAGMVLVDSNHPDEVEKFATELTAAQIEEDHEFVNSNEEGVDVFASFKEVQGAPPLPDLPLVVVTAGISEGWPPGWDAKVFDRLRAEQQADLARLVPGGT